MILEIDAEKAFDKIQHSFLIKKKKKPLGRGHRKNLPPHNKGHIWQTQANIIRNGEKLKEFPLISGTTQGCPVLPLLSNSVLEGLAMAIREVNKIKGIQIWKEEWKLSVFVDGMILYLENPKASTIKLLELISEFGKVNTQKWLYFDILTMKDQKEKLGKQSQLPLYQKDYIT